MTYSSIAQRLRKVLWLAWPIAALVWGSWLGTVAAGDGLHDGLGNVVGADHLAFYSAARTVRDGQPEKMYDYRFMPAYQNEILGGGWESLEAFRNPPFYALLYTPTARWPFPLSMWLWGAIGMAGLALGIILLRASRPRLTFLWALTFYPVLAAVMFGQNTLLSFAIFAGVFRALDDHKPFLAGLIAGLLWYKPQLLVGLFVWWGLMPRTHFRCWLGMSVTALSLAAVSWLVLPSASWAFVDTLRENMAYNSFAQWNVHTPRAFFAQLLPHAPQLAAGLAAFFALGAIGIAAWLVWRTGGPLRVMFPAAVFLSLWSSPHTLIYEWALLLAAGIVLWERFPEKRNAWLPLFTLAWLALLVSSLLAQFQTEGFAANSRLMDLRVSDGFPFVFQLSVPVLAVVGCLAARELGQTLDPASPSVGIIGSETPENPAAATSRT